MSCFPYLKYSPPTANGTDDCRIYARPMINLGSFRFHSSFRINEEVSRTRLSTVCAAIFTFASMIFMLSSTLGLWHNEFDRSCSKPSMVHANKPSPTFGKIVDGGCQNQTDGSETGASTGLVQPPRPRPPPLQTVVYDEPGVSHPLSLYITFNPSIL